MDSKQARRAHWALILLGIALASAAHYLTPPSLVLWHVIFQRLFYLPIVYAAIRLGWQGALLAATLSGLSYIPHIAMTWRQAPVFQESQYVEIAFFFAVGLVTGLLSAREQKRKQELEQATEQLNKVYRDLQDSFEQLKRAQRLSAVGQLAASLAHEIRNPLASLEGAVNVLENPQTSEEVRQEFGEIIKKECRRLNQLLTNLLDFARPRAPQFRSVEAGRLMDSVIDLVRHAARQTGVAVRKEVSLDSLRLECDPEQLQQVILNLVMNAIQAMPNGGEVVLSACQQDSRVLIQVKDQGAGIASEDLDKVFDPFFSTKKGGTGLGLSVAQQIVSQHKGTLEAARNADNGMTFSVLLPVQQR